LLDLEMVVVKDVNFMYQSCQHTSLGKWSTVSSHRSTSPTPSLSSQAAIATYVYSSVRLLSYVSLQMNLETVVKLLLFNMDIARNQMQVTSLFDLSYLNPLPIS
jgi:hypothetical protein